MNGTQKKSETTKPQKWYAKIPPLMKKAVNFLLDSEMDKYAEIAEKNAKEATKYAEEARVHAEDVAKYVKDAAVNDGISEEGTRWTTTLFFGSMPIKKVNKGTFNESTAIDWKKFSDLMENEGLPENNERKQFQENVSQLSEKQLSNMAYDFFNEIKKRQSTENKKLNKNSDIIDDALTKNIHSEKYAQTTDENRGIAYKKMLYLDINKDIQSESVSSNTVENIFKYASAEISLNPNSSLSQMFLGKSGDIMAQNHAKVQEYAGARYAAYIDNDYDKKTQEQQNKIKEIWKDRPLEVIALSVIAEKNLENQLTSRIKNADDLQAKLDNIPQITELAQQLTVADIKESTEKAKTEARPNYELGQVPNDGKSSVKVATGRYA